MKCNSIWYSYFFHIKNRIFFVTNSELKVIVTSSTVQARICWPLAGRSVGNVSVWVLWQKKTWVFLLLICSTSRKSTLTCTTLWLVMAISTVRSQCIVIESKQHSSKSRISSSLLLRRSDTLSYLFVCVYFSRLFGLSVHVVRLSACMHACLTVCLSIYLCVRLPTCLSIYLSTF